MDRAGYTSIIKGLLHEYAAIKPSYGDVEVEIIENDATGHYELRYIGWNGARRIHECVLHVDIKGDNLKKIQGWIPIDGTYDLGPGPRMSQKQQELAYDFSRCMTCGCCVEACPQVSPHSSFIGPAALGQVRLFNSHPTGKLNAEDRLEAITGPDGIASCGNAQNCVQVCPKEIPLTRAIAELHRDTTVYRIKKWLGK